MNLKDDLEQLLLAAIPAEVAFAICRSYDDEAKAMLLACGLIEQREGSRFTSKTDICTAIETALEARLNNTASVPEARSGPSVESAMEHIVKTAKARGT